MNKYVPDDRFAKKAREEGYKARSVYKLQAIDEHYHLLKPGMKVLDLGCAPGSFLQYISEQIGEKGLAVGIDLQRVEKLNLPNVKTYQGDIYEDGLYKKIVCLPAGRFKNGVKKFDLITADLAPKTTGIPFVDGGASLDLNLRVLEVAETYLKKGGGVVMKILSGFNEGDLLGKARKMFKNVKKYRPEAIRKSSHESYIVCMRKI
jgi:23S rRNA (uridine2552-2'-O)-methyltransferase